MAGSGFRIASAYVDVSLQRDRLPEEMAALKADLEANSPTVNIDVDTGMATAKVDEFLASTDAKADVAGHDAGDKMSQGMSQSMVSNSPLIAAAIGGALALGAPAVIAGAGVLFAGIAAVAVHSNADLQATFQSTLTSVEGMFVQAAQVTVPMFQQALTRIGAAAIALGPQFSQVFAALGGPIDSLTTGLIRMAQNVMPGLVSAVQASGPVFQGLATLMADIGTGLSQFFSIIAQHAGAAGQVFAALGSIVQSLLPILGQLVGAGAELAATVLPPLAAVLRVVADALNFLAPVLPEVLAGFLAWRGISAVTGWLKATGDEAGRLRTTLAGVASSMPTAALGGLTAVGAALVTSFVASRQAIDQWGQALLQGGNAAAQATSQMQRWNSFLTQGVSGIASNVFGLTNMASAFGVGSNAMENAQKKAKDLYDAMSPLEQKQQDVTKATNDLQKAIQDYGVGSDHAKAASQELKDKQDALTQAQAQLDTATKGVTQAMLDMANQALAAANSGIAYRQAQVTATDAAKAFQQALAAGTTHLNDNTSASLAYEQALLAQANAAGKAAADASGLTDKMQLQKVSDQAVLAELLNLKAEYGANFPASLQATIDKLQATGINLDQVGQKKPTPTLDLNTGPFDGKKAQADGAMGNLAGQRPTPVANLDTNPLQTQTNFSLDQLYNLGAQRPTPIATLIAQGLQEAENAIDIVARPRSVALYTYVASTNGGPAAAGSPGAIGGAIGDIARRTPIVKRLAGGGSVGGRLFGPGGPTDDLIPAMSEDGAPLLLSNEEFVVRASANRKYGPAKMAAINDGTAAVSTGGGPGGGTIVVQHLDVHLSGTFDFADRDTARQVAVGVRDALVRLEREQQ